MHFYCTKCLKWSPWFQWRRLDPQCEHCANAGPRSAQLPELTAIVREAINKAKN